MTNPIRLLGFGDDITKVRNEIKNNIRLLSSVDTQKKLIKAIGDYNKINHPEKFKKHSPKMSYMSGRAFFELIAIPTLKQVKREPYKIHPSLIMITEGLYLSSDLSKLQKIFKKEGALLYSYLRLEKCCSRYAHFNIHKMERYLKSKGANEKVIESLSNQLPENDPDFDFLFAFTLRQMNLNKIENFLIHQEIIYQNRANYLKFLSILLIDYKGIIPKKVRRITNEWIQGTIMRLRQSKKSKITAATITNSKINNKKTIVEPLPAGWVRIPCKIDIEKIKKYFSFFCSETGGSKDEISFISKEDIDKLFKYGLAYPIDEPKEKRITFNKSQKRPWGILYYFTFKLYQKNCPNNLTLEEKMHYAKFLKHNVQGIGISLKSLNQSLRESASGSLKNNKFQKYYKELG